MSTTFETLFGIDKSGRTKTWEAYVILNEDNTATATITYGLLEGKKQTTTRHYTVGKNIGRSNETTSYEQAISETLSKWKDKREKEGYTTQQHQQEKESSEISTISPPTTQQKILPMLAHVFDPSKQKNKIQFPCYIQPKLDGVRCLCYLTEDGTRVLAQSRTASYFESVGHITTELLRPFLENPELGRNVALDGELYTGSMPFEQLVGLVKKKKLSTEDIGNLRDISYHVYDIIDKDHPDASFHERYQKLRRITEAINSPFVKLVDTQIANNTEEFRGFFSTSIQDGYEGVMLRNMNGKYRCNYRSYDLQKYKEFFEAEYEICGFREAEGRDRGTVIWFCRLPDESGTVFSVRPRGTLEMRRLWFLKGDDYIGKQLTVIYQELSEMGVPRFPVGKCVREGY
jgi:DNA ligase-1